MIWICSELNWKWLRSCISWNPKRARYRSLFPNMEMNITRSCWSRISSTFRILLLWRNAMSCQSNCFTRVLPGYFFFSFFSSFSVYQGNGWTHVMVGKGILWSLLGSIWFTEYSLHKNILIKIESKVFGFIEKIKKTTKKLLQNISHNFFYSKVIFE